MADLILVHLTGKDEEIVLNRDRLVYAKKAPKESATIIKLLGGETLKVGEPLRYLLDQTSPLRPPRRN